MTSAAAGVVVVDAATVLCVRTAPGSARHQTLRHSDFTLNDEAKAELKNFVWEFKSGLQVLVGQSEVVNWVRSTAPESLALMRYGGEYKFAGGSQDRGETLEETARRELAEEFVTEVPASAVLRPFRVNSTRAIQGKSYRMWNFVCLADENLWLQGLRCEAVNAKLQAKRKDFERLIVGGAQAPFWSLDKARREAVSPEVREVVWMDVADVVAVYLSSKSTSLQPVNDFQRKEFSRYGVVRRDPMYASMAVLRSLEKCGSLDGLRAASQEFDKALAAKAAAEARKQRWGLDTAKL